MKPNVYDFDLSPHNIFESNCLYNRHLVKLSNIYNVSAKEAEGKKRFNMFSKNQLGMMEERRRVKQHQFIEQKLRRSGSIR
jgi:hypothetical protein